MPADPPSDNLLRLGRSIESFNSGDLDAWATETFDPGVEYIIAPEHPSARTLYGIDEVLAYQRDWHDMVEGMSLEQDEAIERGDTVFWFGHVCGKGKGSGVEVDVPIAFASNLRDGFAYRVEEFLDLDEARRVAEGRAQD